MVDYATLTHPWKERIMFRISMAITFGIFIAGTVDISTASADSWGCSYEKCIPACTAAGSKFCGKYCSETLAKKRAAGICK
jgi:hypothetical protein